jgi:hypothetical protein
MSRISKRKLMKALKGELEVKPTKDEIFEQFKNPPTQKEWLKGYHKWVQEHTLSTPLSEHEKMALAVGKKRRKKNVND